MKLFAIAALLCLLAGSAHAQQIIHAWDVYGGLYFGNGTHPAVRIEGDVLINDKHSLGFGYNQLTRDGHNAPDDFLQHAHGDLLFNASIPQDYLETFSLTYGHVWLITHRPDMLRVHLKGGLTWGTSHTTNNYHLVYEQGSWFSPQGYFYHFDDHTDNITGLVLNPTLEFTPDQVLGISVGLYSCLNNRQSSFGVEGGIIFGKIRSRIKHYNHK